MVVHKASVAGLGLFVVALSLDVVTNRLPCFAEFDFDDVIEHYGFGGGDGSFEMDFGVWSYCAKDKYIGKEDCEKNVEDAEDWLRAVQILMCFGMFFVALAAVCSLGQLYKGNRGCYSIVLGRIICGSGALGGLLTLIADINYAYEYQSHMNDIFKDGEGYSISSIDVGYANLIEEKHELSWGFWTNLSACVLILTGAVLHVVCKPSSPPSSQGQVISDRGTAMVNIGDPVNSPYSPTNLNYYTNNGFAASPPAYSQPNEAPPSEKTKF